MADARDWPKKLNTANDSTAPTTMDPMPPHQRGDVKYRGFLPPAAVAAASMRLCVSFWHTSPMAEHRVEHAAMPTPAR
jgi:hypothetical protein